MKVELLHRSEMQRERESCYTVYSFKIAIERGMWYLSPFAPFLVVGPKV